MVYASQSCSYKLVDGPEFHNLTESFICAHFEDKKNQNHVTFTAEDGQSFVVRILSLQRQLEAPMICLFSGELVTRNGPPSPVLGFHATHVCGWIDADIGVAGAILLTDTPVSLQLVEYVEE